MVRAVLLLVTPRRCLVDADTREDVDALGAVVEASVLTVERGEHVANGCLAHVTLPLVTAEGVVVTLSSGADVLSRRVPATDEDVLRLARGLFDGGLLVGGLEEHERALSVGG